MNKGPGQQTNIRTFIPQKQSGMIRPNRSQNLLQRKENQLSQHQKYAMRPQAQSQFVKYSKSGNRNEDNYKPNYQYSQPINYKRSLSTQKQYRRPPQFDNYSNNKQNSNIQKQSAMFEQSQRPNQRFPLQNISQSKQINQNQKIKEIQRSQIFQREEQTQNQVKQTTSQQFNPAQQKQQRSVPQQSHERKQNQADQENINRKIFTNYLETQQYSQKNTFLWDLKMFFIILTLVYFILIFILFLYQIPSKDDSYHFNELASVIKYVDLNLKAQPIKSLKVSTNSTCLPNHQKVLLGEWPGTISGCNCGKLQKKCSRICQTIIEPTMKQQLYKWKEHYFCLEKYENWHFFNQQTQSCQSSEFSICDGNTTCVKKNETEKCPVKKIDFQSNYQLVTPETYVKENWDSFQDVLVWYSQEFKESDQPSQPSDDDPYLLYGFDISANGKPCLGLDHQQKRNNKYLLLNTENAGCKTYGEQTFSFKLDEINEQQLYKENINTSVYQNLPGYNDTLQETMWLIQQRKIIPNLIECSKIDVGGYENDILQISSQDRKAYYTTLFVLIMSLMITLLTCLVLSCASSFKIQNDNTRQMRNEVAININFFALLILGVILFTAMIQGYVVFSSQQSKNTQIKDFANEINVKNCFSNYQLIQAAFTKLENDILDMENNIINKYTFITWLNIFYFFLFFLSLIVMLFSSNPLVKRYFSYETKEDIIQRYQNRIQQRMLDKRKNQKSKDQMSSTQIQDSNVRLRNNDVQIQKHPEDQIQQ